MILLVALLSAIGGFVYKKYHKPKTSIQKIEDHNKTAGAFLYAVLCRGDNCFSLNKNGVAYADSPKMGGNLVLNIIDKTARGLNLGEELLKPETIAELSFVKDKLAQDLGISFTQAETSDPNLEDFNFISDKGWVLRLNIGENVYKNVETLKRTLEQIKYSDLPFLDYIDLRIPSKVYYKFK